jgi:nucleotide-binding universal stress UspA family protein
MSFDSYKTVLVHADHSRHAAERIRIAAGIANAEQAHLVGAAMTGVSRYVFENGMLDPREPTLASHLAFLRERAANALAEFETIVKSMGVQSFEKRLFDDEAGGALSLQARYSDLVVIGQPDPDEPAPSAMPDLPEYVVMSGGRPVLIVPYAGQFQHVGQNVLVAWDGGAEATRALSGALPLLRRARNVDVLMFKAQRQPGAPGAQPDTDLAPYLARHGVQVNVVQRGTDIDNGNALLSAAADQSSDLLVMGCYGHSRFREILLGGASRTILDSMTVPVLMAH